MQNNLFVGYWSLRPLESNYSSANHTRSFLVSCKVGSWLEISTRRAPTAGILERFGAEAARGSCSCMRPEKHLLGKEFVEILLTLCLTVKQTGSTFLSRKRTAKTSDFQEAKIRQCLLKDAGNTEANRPQVSLSRFFRTEREASVPSGAKFSWEGQGKRASGKGVFSTPPHVCFF